MDEDGHWDFHGRGKVIGEFVCDNIVRYAKYGYANQMPRYMKSSVGGYPATEIHYASLQLSPTELYDYGKGKPLFGWHISDLVIYDEPKGLNDFGVKRAPMSWGYVYANN